MFADDVANTSVVTVLNKEVEFYVKDTDERWEWYTQRNIPVLLHVQ